MTSQGLNICKHLQCEWKHDDPAALEDREGARPCLGAALVRVALESMVDVERPRDEYLVRALDGRETLERGLPDLRAVAGDVPAVQTDHRTPFGSHVAVGHGRLRVLEGAERARTPRKRPRRRRRANKTIPFRNESYIVVNSSTYGPEIQQVPLDLVAEVGVERDLRAGAEEGREEYTGVQ